MPPVATTSIPKKMEAVSELSPVCGKTVAFVAVSVTFTGVSPAVAGGVGVGVGFGVTFIFSSLKVTFTTSCGLNGMVTRISLSDFE